MVAGGYIICEENRLFMYRHSTYTPKDTWHVTQYVDITFSVFSVQEATKKTCCCIDGAGVYKVNSAGYIIFFE